MGLLDGMVALVAGGSQGVGCGIAVRFAKEGAHVVVVDRDMGTGTETLRAIQNHRASSKFIRADIDVKTDACQAVRDAVASFGRIDILVNASEHTTPFLPLEEKTDDLLSKSLAAGLFGTFWMMQSAFPFMRDQGGGRILIIGSIYGDVAPCLVGDYSAAMHAVQGLVRSAAKEWGRFNIRVNNLIPAANIRPFQAIRANHPERTDKRIKALALQRIGDPERDIGGAAVFLVSEDSRFITGQVLYADGGQFLALPVLNPELAVVAPQS